MKLQPGDSIYYEVNLALGFLLERHEVYDDSVEEYRWQWKYILRSPPRSDLTNVLWSHQVGWEEDFIEAISNGRFTFHEGRRPG